MSVRERCAPSQVCERVLFVARMEGTEEKKKRNREEGTKKKSEGGAGGRSGCTSARGARGLQAQLEERKK